MKGPHRILILIVVITILALVVDLPENVPLKFSIGPLRINRVINPPHIVIPQLGIDKRITTHLGLDLLGGIQLVLETDMKDVAVNERTRALESAREIIERRVNFFGVSEPVIQSAQVGQSYRVVVELPGLKNTNEALELIGKTAQLEFREFIDVPASVAATLSPMQGTKASGVTGKDLKKAEVSFNPQTGEPVVAFEMTEEGAKKFGQVTQRLIGKRLAIFLDETPLSAPVVQQAITEGKGTITGSFSTEEAKRLALQLAAGALPTPIKIIEQRTIGATLGATSVEKSIRAGLVGLFLVALFMVVYYGKLGFLADIALIIYGLITFAIFRLIPVTLTLPGIAGFILSIGMAVDGTILIFARLKEELAKGKPWQIALELAFGRAWDSIRDANVTTLITAFILYNPLNWSFIPVSGVVRGFAFTLTVGVLVSLFTGIVVTRNLIRVFYKSKMAIAAK
jgi:preprotein translocase subunit SecD